MGNQFSRTELMIGNDFVKKLQRAHVAVFGVGGVGGYVVEALVRAGIGELTIVDNDVVSESNLNRQIIALHSTVGRLKVDVMEERALDINPELKLHKICKFVLPENVDDFDFSQFDFIVDCIDTVSAKLAIIEKVAGGALRGGSPAGRGGEQQSASQGKAFPSFKNLPFITCLGTGNKLNPMGFEVAAIEKTSVCPLARVMRRELKARGISGVKCVYSKEEPVKNLPPMLVEPVETSDGKRDLLVELVETSDSFSKNAACSKKSGEVTTGSTNGGGESGVISGGESAGHHTPGSVSFVPGAAGLLLASEVVKFLMAKED